MKRSALGACTPAQRERVQQHGCLVCGDPNVDPAHLIPRGLCPYGADDPEAVVGLCRQHHRMYDESSFDLSPYLEPRYRAELAHAVFHFGLFRTVRRVSNSEWAPVERAA